MTTKPKTRKIIAALPVRMIAALDRVRKQQGKTRVAVIREAVNEYLEGQV